jgi:TonB family protein
MGGLPVPAVAAGVIVVAAAGLYFALSRGPKAPPPAVPTPVPAPTAIPTPAPPPTPAIAGKDDPDFQKAVAAKLAEEEKKVQERMARKQEEDARRRKAEDDRVALEGKKAKDAEEALKSARDRADKEEADRLQREATEARQREEAARAAAQAALPKTKDGDLVDVSEVDTPPRASKIVKPEPTAMAIRQHVSGTVVLRVLVDENGKPGTIEVVRDTAPKVGLADACKTAVAQWVWTPAQKDGKRVKTWIVVPIPFQKL